MFRRKAISHVTTISHNCRNTMLLYRLSKRLSSETEVHSFQISVTI